VRESIDEHQAAMGRHMRLITQFHFSLTVMNAAPPRLDRLDRHLVWAHARSAAGVVATALPLAWHGGERLGWVSWSDRHLREHRRGAAKACRPSPCRTPPPIGRTQHPLEVSRATSASRTSLSITVVPASRQCSTIWRSRSARRARRALGRSGAGKSTLVNLLLRFFDPEQAAS